MDPAGDRLASLLAENYLVRKQWNQFVLVKGAAIGSEIIMLREEMTSVKVKALRHISMLIILFLITKIVEL